MDCSIGLTDVFWDDREERIFSAATDWYIDKVECLLYSKEYENVKTEIATRLLFYILERWDSCDFALSGKKVLEFLDMLTLITGVECTNTLGETPLYFAIHRVLCKSKSWKTSNFYQDIEIALDHENAYLEKSYIYLDTTKREKLTTLYSEHGYGIVEHLVVNLKANLNKPSPAICWSVSNHLVITTALLLRAGANANAVDILGEPLLNMIAFNYNGGNSLTIASLLINEGINLNFKGSSKEYPIINLLNALDNREDFGTIYQKVSNMEMNESLNVKVRNKMNQQKNAKFQFEFGDMDLSIYVDLLFDNVPIIKAVERGLLFATALYIRKGANINVFDKYGNTLLQIAATKYDETLNHEYLYIAKYLLVCGIDQNMKNNKIAIEDDEDVYPILNLMRVIYDTGISRNVKDFLSLAFTQQNLGEDIKYELEKYGAHRTCDPRILINLALQQCLVHYQQQIKSSKI